MRRLPRMQRAKHASAVEMLHGGNYEDKDVSMGDW